MPCPSISGAAPPQSDAVNWVKNDFRFFVIGNNTNGLGYQESGFQQEVYSNGQTLTVLNGTNDYVFPASSSNPGSANTSVGTFANGTLDFVVTVPFVVDTPQLTVTEWHRLG